MDIRPIVLDEALRKVLMSNLSEPAYADVLDDHLAEIAADPAHQYIGLVAHDDSVALCGYAHVQGRHPALLDVITTRVDPGPTTRALLNEALSGAQQDVQWWVRGTDAAIAVDVAAEVGAIEDRRVLRMHRAKDDVDGAPVPTRAFTHDDAARVVEINNAAFVGHGDRSAWDVATLAGELAKLGHRYEDLLIAPVNAKPLGFCWVKRHNETTAEIYVLAAHPESRGSGLGGGLLRSGLCHIYDVIGAQTALLYVEANNARAIALYERHGFSLDAEQLVAYRIAQQQVLSGE